MERRNCRSLHTVPKWIQTPGHLDFCESSVLPLSYWAPRENETRATAIMRACGCLYEWGPTCVLVWPLLRPVSRRSAYGRPGLLMNSFQSSESVLLADRDGVRFTFGTVYTTLFGEWHNRTHIETNVSRFPLWQLSPACGSPKRVWQTKSTVTYYGGSTLRLQTWLPMKEILWSQWHAITFTCLVTLLQHSIRNNIDITLCILSQCT